MSVAIYPGAKDKSSPAGKHSEGLLYHRRFSSIHETPLFSWQRKKLPTPGAQNYAFESLGLVEFTPIGAGVWARHANFQLTQPPQLYVAAQAVPTSGLGGLQAGQIALQPLIDPYNAARY